MKTYAIAEVFYSLQGEGVRAGCPSIFVRFAGCNLSCTASSSGFDCDTDFDMRMRLDADGIWGAIREAKPSCLWLVLTGGEPTLQVDQALVDYLKGLGYRLAIETNGTRPVPTGIDWITVSPKRGTDIVQTTVSEVKYVLDAGDDLPRHNIRADHYIVSPAFAEDEPRLGALEHCIDVCLANPALRLSVQQHKRWGLR